MSENLTRSTRNPTTCIPTTTSAMRTPSRVPLPRYGVSPVSSCKIDDILCPACIRSRLATTVNASPPTNVRTRSMICPGIVQKAAKSWVVSPVVVVAEEAAKSASKIGVMPPPRWLNGMRSTRKPMRVSSRKARTGIRCLGIAPSSPPRGVNALASVENLDTRRGWTVSSIVVHELLSGVSRSLGRGPHPQWDSRYSLPIVSIGCPT